MRTRETRARNKHAVSCTHLVELISVFVILFSKSLASASASSSTLSVGSQKVGANEYIDSITTSGGEGGTAAKVDGNGDDDDDDDLDVSSSLRERLGKMIRGSSNNNNNNNGNANNDVRLDLQQQQQQESKTKNICVDRVVVVLDSTAAVESIL
mmetsp:Transcript_4237/g.9181  ORF Transcript_4237/g.9181 Transcript_4237/m.9181 type:complete len:154 (+) Transcript_4237:207-668(+)